MSDEEFLGYVDIHSQTPRHLFSKEHVFRLLEMAGVNPEFMDIRPPIPDFIPIDDHEARELIAMARDKKVKEYESRHECCVHPGDPLCEDKDCPYLKDCGGKTVADTLGANVLPFRRKKQI